MEEIFRDAPEETFDNDVMSGWWITPEVQSDKLSQEKVKDE